jgi:hypothetical protein
MNAKKVNLKKK